MKKYAILFILAILPLIGFSQLRSEYVLDSIADNDSIYWTKVGGNSAIEVLWDFTDLSGNTALATPYYGYYDRTEDAVKPVSMEKSSNIYTTRYPLTMSKSDTTWMNAPNGDTTYVFGVKKSLYLYEYIGLGVVKNGNTGSIIQTIVR